MKIGRRLTSLSCSSPRLERKAPMLMLRLVSGVTISVFVKSMLPSPGWGLGKAAPAPAGTSAVAPATAPLAVLLLVPVGEGTGTTVPLGMTTTELVAPIVSCLIRRKVFRTNHLKQLEYTY